MENVTTSRSIEGIHMDNTLERLIVPICSQ